MTDIYLKTDRLRKSVARLLLSFTLAGSSFLGFSQNFEIQTDVSDTLSPSSYLINVSGFATFTDSMILEINLITADSLESVVYSGYKDFSTGGLNTLTNFTYDANSEAFSLDIGTYSSLNYRVRVASKINGIPEEELFIDAF